MIGNSEVVRILSSLGYATVNFETGYKWLQLDQPDYFLSAFSNVHDRYRAGTGLNEFELLVIKTTAAIILFDLQVNLPNSQTADFYDILASGPKNIHRERLQFTLRMLPEIADNIPGPKFVYAHITFPHPPYLYGPGGEILRNEPKDLLSAYRDQVIYINSELVEILPQIISVEPAPIVILQSDHGAVLPYERLGLDRREKMAVLNAIYLQGTVYENLNANISLVNTFRFVFDSYWNAGYGILPDVSIFKNEKVELPCES
jgi:hypothetical protein